MIRLRVLVAAVGGAALVLGSTSLAVAQYPPAPGAQCVRTLDQNENPDSSFPQGGPIVVEGFAERIDQRCFDPDTDVTVTFERNPVIVFAVVTADEFGDYRAPQQGTGSIPRDMEPGPWTVRAAGVLNGVPTSYTTGITVTAVGASRLPRTGGPVEVALLVFWALGLLVIGSILISVTWKRWRAAREEARLMADRFAPSFLDAGVDVSPYRPALPADEVVAEEVVEAEVVEELPALDIEDTQVVEADPEPVEEPREPVGVGAYPETSVQEVAQNGADRASDVVSRLQEEIAAWTKR